MGKTTTYKIFKAKSQKQRSKGNSLAVQWLGLHAFTAMPRVQSLVGELRSRKPGDVAKKKSRGASIQDI